ncbi:hypothetical protein DL96DRAFT_1823873 [Flagelloscypha sp. PMI_526]|nr:hypothetical protein DL96DRAFT_1823873 [Flagelloscypha sp. PMI_526]
MGVNGRGKRFVNHFVEALKPDANLKISSNIALSTNCILPASVQSAPLDLFDIPLGPMGGIFRNSTIDKSSASAKSSSSSIGVSPIEVAASVAIIQASIPFNGTTQDPGHSLAPPFKSIKIVRDFMAAQIKPNQAFEAARAHTNSTLELSGICFAPRGFIQIFVAVFNIDMYKGKNEVATSYIHAKNNLESYASNLWNSINDKKLADKLSLENKTRLIAAVHETIVYLHNSELS